MIIGILKEIKDNRVAMVPKGIKKIKSEEVSFAVEQGAGERASLPDTSFEKGATVVDRQKILKESDVILSIAPMPGKDLKQVKKGTLLISMFAPFEDQSIIAKLDELGLHAISMDMIPRTTLAQSMDILSSMAAIAGYKAVLVAANHLPRYFPMMITAAGSIRPAKVLVIGAGVAGLQAIATAKRLGAVVMAFDVRRASKEEVQSLGAEFMEIQGAADEAEAGGYAVEQGEDYLNKQREELQNRASKVDIIIATAQVRGGKAPILLSKETVERMKTGAVIVDLAAATGGNCELTKDNEIYTHKGVKIIGNSALASEMPRDASTLFGNNILNLLNLIIKDGELNLDMDNEIIRASLITKTPIPNTHT